MKKIALFSTSLASMFVALLSTTPAQALEFKTFVSAAGSGTACTRAAPCGSFLSAHDATQPGGEIICLDTDNFGGFGVTKSITIDCGGTAARSNGISVNAPGVVVKLRNLSITAAGADNVGIDWQNGAALYVENCLIANYSLFSVLPATGIRFRPSVSGSQLVVTDTSISNNGSGSTGGGIVVNPQSGGNARVTLNRVTVAGNVFGIVADGTGSTGGINMTISDSVSNGNRQDGIIAVTPAGGAPIGVLVTNTKSTNNSIGIRSIGPNVTVRVDGSRVIGNGTGLSFSGGGALLSAGNNMIQANGVNGAFSGSVGLQ